MPSSLKNDLEKQVNKRVNALLEKVSEKSKLSVDELRGMWNEVCGVKEKKVSNFQRFCKTERPKLQNKHPEYKFGDMNKELGKMWKKLSDKEKEKFSS